MFMNVADIRICGLKLTITIGNGNPHRTLSHNFELRDCNQTIKRALYSCKGEGESKTRNLSHLLPVWNNNRYLLNIRLAVLWPNWHMSCIKKITEWLPAQLPRLSPLYLGEQTNDNALAKTHVPGPCDFGTGFSERMDLRTRPTIWDRYYRHQFNTSTLMANFWFWERKKPHDQGFYYPLITNYS